MDTVFSELRYLDDYDVVVSYDGVVYNAETIEPLKTYLNFDGYEVFRCKKNSKMVRVHRMVALAFIPNPFNDPFVNHLDGVRNHNSANNLEWCTQKENMQHSSRRRLVDRNDTVKYLSKTRVVAYVDDTKLEALKKCLAKEHMSISAWIKQIVHEELHQV